MTDRELDAQVAEQVFDIPVVWVDGEPMEADSNEGYGPTDPVERYSTDIVAAMDVMEEVRQLPENGGQFDLTWRHHTKWSASFGEQSYVWADTVPEAICRAALAPKGVLV